MHTHTHTERKTDRQSDRQTYGYCGTEICYIFHSFIVALTPTNKPLKYSNWIPEGRFNLLDINLKIYYCCCVFVVTIIPPNKSIVNIKFMVFFLLPDTHRSDKPSTSCASSMAAVSAAAAAAVASIASSQAAAAASSATVSSHMTHHPHHPHAPPHHVPHHLPPLSAHHHHHHPNSSLLAAASMSHSLGLGGPPGLRPPPGHIPDMCPVCGIKLSADEWNSHFLTELDRLYKLSSGMERSNLQATYMFAQPCPSQENAIRTSHNRWEVSRGWRIWGQLGEKLGQI